ncbi:MAG: glycosyltransferase [Sediminibacterium sp.]|nr:glycosyltransferase [Sediminibacterium sp.]
MQKIFIIGPAWPLRGGLASFNERLARECMRMGYHTELYTFSLQYPDFLFPGTTQYSSEPAPTDLVIHRCIHSMNPFNWIAIGRQIRKQQPDVIIVRYWLPLMGPCLGSILRIAKRKNKTRVVCIADNIIPHEHRPGDTLFTRYFVKAIDGFITMSDQVLQQLKKFSQQPAACVVHPLYDHFGDIIPMDAARKQLGLPASEKIILFFGFIRKYKGLDLLLQAMAHPAIRAAKIHLLVAGEFYDKPEEYLSIIEQEQLQDRVILRTDFIPDSMVKYYLSAADFVIQPYRNATQSGVTPLAYHFEKPMLVTNVGGLPDRVADGKTGIITQPTPEAIAAGILELYAKGANHFIPYMQEEKKLYSWQKLVEALLNIGKQ